MQLIPIKEHIDENENFINEPDCREGLYMTIEFYTRVGFNTPWIGYFVKVEDKLVGGAAFKGKPVNNKVEIAYGVFPGYQQRGIGTRIAAELVSLSLSTDPSVIITARTMPENDYSNKVLRKNNFIYAETVTDPEDGEVWEWVYEK